MSLSIVVRMYVCFSMCVSVRKIYDACCILDKLHLSLWIWKDRVSSFAGRELQMRVDMVKLLLPHRDHVVVALEGMCSNARDKG